MLLMLLLLLFLIIIQLRGVGGAHRSVRIAKAPRHFESSDILCDNGARSFLLASLAHVCIDGLLLVSRVHISQHVWPTHFPEHSDQFVHRAHVCVVRPPAE